MDETQRGIRFPEGQDKPAWPDDFERMAADIDELMPRFAGGITRITPQANQVTKGTVQFPEGLFTSPPNMLATVDASTAVGNTLTGLSVGTTADVSTTSGDIFIYRSSTTTRPITWVAWQNGGGASARGWQHPQYAGSNNTVANPTRFLNSLESAVLAGLVKVDVGKVTFPANKDVSQSQDVTFKKGLFTKPPYVIATPQTTVPQRMNLLGVTNKTKTGCEIWQRRSSNVANHAYWLAFELTDAGRLWPRGGAADLPSKFMDFAQNVEKRVPRIDSGYANVTPIANEGTPFRVEFDTTFSRAPWVGVIAGTAVPGVTVKGTGVDNVTATGMDVYVYRTNTTLTGVRWLAVEP